MATLVGRKKGELASKIERLQERRASLAATLDSSSSHGGNGSTVKAHQGILFEKHTLHCLVSLFLGLGLGLDLLLFPVLRGGVEESKKRRGFNSISLLPFSRGLKATSN